jgi:hypothetical protein
MTSAFKLIFVSYQPDLGPRQDGGQERALRRGRLDEVFGRPMHDIYLTTQLSSHVVCCLIERRESGLADHEKIDVARGIVASGHIRTEEEGESNAGILLEHLSQPHWHPARPAEEVPQGRIEGMLAVDPPKAKTTQPTAAQYTARFEAFQSALCGVGVRFGSANDLVRVQFLTRRRRKKRQDARRRFAPNQGMARNHHVRMVYDYISFDNTRVVIPMEALWPAWSGRVKGRGNDQRFFATA